MKSFKALMFVFAVIILSILNSCKKESSDTSSYFKFKDDYNEFEINNAELQLVEKFDMYKIESKLNNEVVITINFPKTVEKGKTYVENVILSINHPECPQYSSYENLVTLHIDDITENKVKGSFSGLFFYVVDAKTVDMNITGQFDARK